MPLFITLINMNLITNCFKVYALKRQIRNHAAITLQSGVTFHAPLRADRQKPNR